MRSAHNFFYYSTTLVDVLDPLLLNEQIVVYTIVRLGLGQDCASPNSGETWQIAVPMYVHVCSDTPSTCSSYVWCTNAFHYDTIQQGCNLAYCILKTLPHRLCSNNITDVAQEYATYFASGVQAFHHDYRSHAYCNNSSRNVSRYKEYYTALNSILYSEWHDSIIIVRS